jgi:hypothetical protein
LATISETVVLTSNPVPLVGDPKLNPTVPISFSRKRNLQLDGQIQATADWKESTKHR